MSKRDSLLLLEDALESIDKIISYTKGLSFKDFSNDSKTIDAVVRNFEIIGEAASQLPTEFKRKHPDIDWHQIIGLRNRVIHEYFGVDLKIIWTIVNDELMNLREQIQDFL